MIRGIFETIWRLAAQATFMMACVLLVRPLLKKMPRNLTCLLWAALAIRLLLPWSVPVALPEGAAAIGQIQAGPVWETGEETVGAAGQPGHGQGSAVSVQPAEGQRSAEESMPSGAEAVGGMGAAPDAVLSLYRNTAGWRAAFFRVCPFLWAVGAAAVCVYWIAMDFRLKKRVREAVLVKKIRKRVRVMECDRIETAFAAGIFRPAIYLPDSLKNPDRRYVLLHEETHLRRKDHIWKWLACLLLCIYWFHPLLWICVPAFSRDVEEACDEAVLKRLGKGGRLPYARAIFHEADAEKMRWAAAPGFSEGNMKKRVKHVLEYRKKATAGVILAAVVILGACGPFFMEKKEAADGTAGIESMERDEEWTGADPEQNGEAAGVSEEQGDAAESQSGRDEYGYSADYVEKNTWTVQPVTQEELTDPVMAADEYWVMLRRNEGVADNVRLSYGNPVPDARLSDRYGVRVNPFTQEKRLHSGVDFAAEEGTPVLAAAPGIVVESGFETACGYYVILRHANGDLTYYAHCSEILAEETEAVKAGEQIAKVGSTGMSTGPHLHFALSRDGVFIDPFAEPGVSVEEEEPAAYRESLTEAELAETEKIALDYCNQMNWGSVLSIEAVADDCELYDNEGVEAEYEPGNIIIYAVATKEDEAAGNPKRTVSVAREHVKLSWKVINGGFSAYREE